MSAKKQPSRMGLAIAEMAEDQYRGGIMDAETFEEITLRHLGVKSVLTAKPISSEQIRKTREQGHLSQAPLPAI